MQNNLPTFGINGFGRIGRTSLRVWWKFHRNHSQLIAVNTSGSMEIENWAHLLKYDSNYGVFDAEITTERYQSIKDASDENPVLGTITLDSSHSIIITAQRDPAKIPWDKMLVDIVLESTGAFLSEKKAKLHLDGGAKKVILSAPAKDESIGVSVLGVADSGDISTILSNASCTTNCVAPVAQIITKHFGVEKAILTTVHSYTDDQNTHDNSHKKDLRRARAAAQNIVPTNTGAAQVTTRVVPELSGLFDGLAVRVPTPTGSLSDITFLISKETTKEEINSVLTQESQLEKWKNIFAVTNEPIVSSDIVGRRESSIVDLDLTRVVGGNLVKIISWYDNEFGYCNRLVEQVTSHQS